MAKSRGVKTRQIEEGASRLNDLKKLPGLSSEWTVSDILKPNDIPKDYQGNGQTVHATHVCGYALYIPICNWYAAWKKLKPTENGSRGRYWGIGRVPDGFINEDGLQWCNFCRLLHSRDWFTASAWGHYNDCRLGRMSRHHNMSDDRVAETRTLMAEQILNPRCWNKGCLHPKEPRGVGWWHYDHDPETGLFRGWLCHDCNTALRGIRMMGPLLEYAGYKK